jgi:hypothetical protein
MCYIRGMVKALRFAIAAGVLGAWCLPAMAETRSPWALTRRDEDLQVSLVTFGRGDEIHQYFGHNALMVEDKERELGALYNFGMFDFGPDMLPKYLQGQLEFWAAATPIAPTYHQYMEENRSIRVRELNLSPSRRRFLAERLSYYVQPEHRSYLYHHYANNCSTKVRDMLDAALDGQLRKVGSSPARFTYRGHTRRYTQQDPIVHMLLLLWMNDSMERPIRRYDEAFLPDELERMVDSAQYVDETGHKVPLVRSAYTVFEAPRAPVPETPSRAWPGLLAFGALLGGLALALARWARGGGRVARALLGLHSMALGVLFGVPGLVAFLFLFTKWDVTHYNENLLLANPITFLLFPLGFWTAFGSKRAQRWLGSCWIALASSSLLLLALKLLPNFDQDTHLPMALFLPVNLGCGLAHLALRRGQAVAVVPAVGARVAG